MSQAARKYKFIDLDIMRETAMLFAFNMKKILLGKDQYYPTYPQTPVIIKCCITR